MIIFIIIISPLLCRTEAEVVEEIVKETYKKLRFSADSKELVPRELVGINSRVEKLKSYLAIEPNKFGGTGRMGKTTLARVVYDMLFDQFEASCFINDVRENYEKMVYLGYKKNFWKSFQYAKPLM